MQRCLRIGFMTTHRCYLVSAMIEWLPIKPTSELLLDELFDRLKEARGKGKLVDFEVKMLPQLYGAWKADRLSEKQMNWILRTVHSVRKGDRNHDSPIDYIDEE